MVKGNTRQVVVVREPGGALFEQAIFFLREEGAAVGEQELLAEARRLAALPQRAKKRLPPLFWFLMGMAAVLPICIVMAIVY